MRCHPVSGCIVFHIGGYAPVSVPRRRKSSGPASASRIPSVPASWPWFRSPGYRKSLLRSESFPAVLDGSGCLLPLPGLRLLSHQDGCSRLKISLPVLYGVWRLLFLPAGRAPGHSPGLLLHG